MCTHARSRADCLYAEGCLPQRKAALVIFVLVFSPTTIPARPNNYKKITCVLARARSDLRHEVMKRTAPLAHKLDLDDFGLPCENNSTHIYLLRRLFW